MTRTRFLTASSCVAFAVACLALLFPDVVLSTKGVDPTPALCVWVRQAGVLIFASGLSTFLVRAAPDSGAMRAVLIGGASVHFGLFPIELVAYAQGVIGTFSGIAPNSLLHLLLGAGFVRYAWRVRSC